MSILIEGGSLHYSNQNTKGLAMAGAKYLHMHRATENVHTLVRCKRTTNFTHKIYESLGLSLSFS